MILLKIAFFGGILYGFIDYFYKRYSVRKEYETAVKEQEKRYHDEMSRQHEESRKKRTEIEKQLEAVRYQLDLLGALDRFVDHESGDEKDIKKALQHERQYNALYTKERKLKKELEKLEY